MERAHPLIAVKEGMAVYDSNGHKVGSVRQVFMGAPSDEAASFARVDPDTIDPEMYAEESVFEDGLEALRVNMDIPDTVRKRLLHHGYVRIDSSGLFRTDRFAFTEQVASVSDDGVRLSVEGDSLVH